MTHPLVAIEERAHMQKHGFKAFRSLKLAYEYMQKHPNWECRLRKSVYKTGDVRFIVNYQR